MSDPGAYAKRFSGPWSDEVLRRRIEVKAVRVERLHTFSPEVAADKLRYALATVVVPTEGMLAVIRQLIDLARGYCDRAYADDLSVLSLVTGSRMPPEDALAICMTGLAGVGKSAILDAFCRVFIDIETMEIPGHASFETRAFWRMRIRDRAGFAALVQPHFRDQSAIKGNRALGIAITEAAAQGIALILPDEFQFITSTDANALMAKLLFCFTQIGPPVVFACNFSMVNALWRRPPQDRDRLLLNPIIVLPESLGQDWDATVDGCLDVAQEFSALRSPERRRQLHDHTFGIKRCLRSLLVLAYLEMRRSGCHEVKSDHLLAAYRSVAYATMRCDVENLIQGAITPMLLRQDLKCPLVPAPAAPASKTAIASPAQQAHASDATQQALRSMVTPEAQKILAALDGYASDSPPSKEKPPRRPPASAENLLGGADRFSQRHRDKP